MNNLLLRFKNFGLLEFLVLFSAFYVILMLLWTASTRSAVAEKAQTIKSNHKEIVDFINSEINNCDQADDNAKTKWGDLCKSEWISEKIVDYINKNIKINNPHSSKLSTVKPAQDPRLQAEGKAGQSTDKGIIFVSENNFESDAGSEWIIGTCIKSPCVAAGNNELVSAYR